MHQTRVCVLIICNKNIYSYYICNFICILLCCFVKYLHMCVVYLGHIYLPLYFYIPYLFSYQLHVIFK